MPQVRERKIRGSVKKKRRESVLVPPGRKAHPVSVSKREGKKGERSGSESAISGEASRKEEKKKKNGHFI